MACATQASATTVCYPRDQMLSYIERDYKASQAANGIVRPYSVMEVWVSDKDGDWLIVTTDMDGNSCIVAYGEDFSGRLAKPVEQS
ncbi:MAG: hypothetical protein ACU0GG_07050 [Paracoccaceae bacterium]